MNITLRNNFAWSRVWIFIDVVFHENISEKFSFKLNFVSTRSKKSLIPSSQQEYQDPICWSLRSQISDHRSQISDHTISDLFGSIRIQFLCSLGSLKFLNTFLPHRVISILKALQLRCELKMFSGKSLLFVVTKPFIRKQTKTYVHNEYSFFKIR